MRELVTIRKIKEILPIEGADRIVVAKIDGWQCVTQKSNNFKPGDDVLYFEVDSFIPASDPRFSWLEKDFRDYNGSRGARLRTIRLKKRLSQGLILPLNEFPELQGVEGNLADVLGVVKYDPEIATPGKFTGEMAGPFPSFIPKTDQERIQNIWSEVKTGNDIYEVSVKEDGSSVTYAFYDGDFIACSRNFKVRDSEKSILWKIARDYAIEQQLRDRWQFVAIQGELVGPGVNGNRAKYENNDFMVFDIWDIENARYFNSSERLQFCEEMGLTHVKILEHRPFTFDTIEEALEYSNKKVDGRIIEGLVWKSVNDTSHHFKVINNEYLLKHGD